MATETQKKHKPPKMRNYVVIPLRDAPPLTVTEVTQLEIVKGTGDAVFFRGKDPALVIAAGEYHSITLQNDEMTKRLRLMRDSYSYSE